VKKFSALALALVSLFWLTGATWLPLFVPASVPIYTGPGDVVSGATNWYGLRAYNAAYATGSNPAAIVCDSATFTTCSTINILANGKFDTATASGSAACATTCVVKQIYDQTATANHATCSSAATCPTLTFNCIGTLPCLTFAGNQPMNTGAAATYTSPATVSWVANRTGATSSFGGIFGSNVGTLDNGYSAATNTGRMGFNSTDATFTLSDNATHAVQLIENGASSTANVDNTTTATTVGSGTLSAISTRIASFNGLKFTGTIMEVGIWSTVGFSSTNQTNMCHNQFAYWGTVTSC
jgi:hypothetical protein